MPHANTNTAVYTIPNISIRYAIARPVRVFAITPYNKATDMTKDTIIPAIFVIFESLGYPERISLPLFNVNKNEINRATARPIT